MTSELLTRLVVTLGVASFYYLVVTVLVAPRRLRRYHFPLAPKCSPHVNLLEVERLGVSLRESPFIIIVYIAWALLLLYIAYLYKHILVWGSWYGPAINIVFDGVILGTIALLFRYFIVRAMFLKPFIDCERIYFPSYFTAKQFERSHTSILIKRRVGGIYSCIICDGVSEIILFVDGRSKGMLESWLYAGDDEVSSDPNV